ncbi:DinB family protein [Terriglobus roseus DSM 18391]|uniref:DinB family protein n=1 Tax=Terriglobus roseus (strain DSM 18391 / NRRL B-41598 / KBS 63) TaxID=926566 RepID=I3ZKJ9_TERRK|nr:DinB family protein [Terriglobus roseus]AFL89767.1 DinB family protein [Terriglobus roseus DSM 18391]
MKRFVPVAVLCCSVVFAAAAGAQAVPAAALPVVHSSPAASLDAVQTLIEKEWMGLADAMPADKYAFAPSAEDFKGELLKPDYTGVRTFGQEVAHVAAANFSFAAAISASKPTVDLKAVSTAFDKPTAHKNLVDSFAALHAAIATLTPENAWDEAKTPGTTRAGTVAYNFGHMRDHYGQLVEYLRMNGMTPPASTGRPLANPTKKS